MKLDFCKAVDWWVFNRFLQLLNIYSLIWLRQALMIFVLFRSIGLRQAKLFLETFLKLGSAFFGQNEILFLFSAVAIFGNQKASSSNNGLGSLWCQVCPTKVALLLSAFSLAHHKPF